MDLMFLLARGAGISFLVTLLVGPFLIPVLRKLKFGQTIREEGPQSHIAKNGTPTMGGIMMFAGILAGVIASGYFDWNTVFMLVAIFGFGLIGFIDDYIKVVLKRSLGLRAYQKLIGQFSLGIALGVYQLNHSDFASSIHIPFTSEFFDLGIMYVPFVVLVLVATSNSVNLTDGLDGLASSVTLIASIAFSVIAYKFGYTSIAICGFAVSGACLGFLKFNRYPAKVFMGDTGSMALGGAIGAMAVLMNMSLLIPVIGCIYFMESLSVIIQVISFKTRGKRVFKMSPIHHHFELCGWKEVKVVKVFCVITLIAGMIGVMSI